MAKLALINREAKRRATVAKFAAKRAALKAIINDASRSMDERLDARAQLEKLPRNASPVRLRNRCAITGRPRGNFRKTKATSKTMKLRPTTASLSSM